VAVATGGVVAMSTVSGASTGDQLTPTATGIAVATEAAPGATIGTVVGTTDDGRMLVYIDPH
jgi:hypothetical protein